VCGLNKPTDEERGQWFSTLRQTTTDGEIVLYDRFRYNRAGVRRVMGFYEPVSTARFMRQTPEFERMLTRFGYQTLQILVLGHPIGTSSPL
jgi:polyphosphate kinase 2 (PPK2 family)